MVVILLLLLCFNAPNINSGYSRKAILTLFLRTRKHSWLPKPTKHIMLQDKVSTLLLQT